MPPCISRRKPTTSAYLFLVNLGSNVFPFQLMKFPAMGIASCTTGLFVSCGLSILTIPQTVEQSLLVTRRFRNCNTLAQERVSRTLGTGVALIFVVDVGLRLQGSAYIKCPGRIGPTGWGFLAGHDRVRTAEGAEVIFPSIDANMITVEVSGCPE